MNIFKKNKKTMTYKDIQNEYRLRNNKTISSCSIADAKRKLGYNVKISINRKDKKRVQKQATKIEIKEISIILGKKTSP